MDAGHIWVISVRHRLTLATRHKSIRASRSGAVYLFTIPTLAADYG